MQRDHSESRYQRLAAANTFINPLVPETSEVWPPSHRAWKFYYGTCLDLLITTRGSFETAAEGTELMESLKGRFLWFSRM